HMQKCGQLHASMAVALIAQSAAGAAEWPALTLSRAIIVSNAIRCIGAPLTAGQYAPAGHRRARNSFRFCAEIQIACGPYQNIHTLPISSFVPLFAVSTGP